MSITLQTIDQVYFYLRSKDIDINKYKYREENNMYGIEGVIPIKNPYLWNHMLNENITEPLELLLNYKQELVNPRLVNAILTSQPDFKVNDCNISKSKIIALLDILKEKEALENNVENLLISLISKGYDRVVKIILSYIKKNDIEIKENGSFMRESLAEASKSGNMELVKLIMDSYPNAIKKSDDWPYLNAIKRGFYEMALYFLKNGNNYHAKNDLGYKLLERNDKKRIASVGKNKEAHDFIMDLYRGKVFI